MTKIKILAALLTALILFSACSSDDKTDNSSAANDSTASAQKVNPKFVGETYKMLYSFPKDLSLKYKLTSIENTTQTIASADTSMTSDITQTTDYVFHIKSLGPEAGNYKLDVTINSIKSKATYQDQVVEFDTEKESDDATKKRFAEYAALKGASYTVVVDGAGMIQDVDGVDEILNNYMKIQGAPSLTADQRVQATSQIKEGMLQPLTQQMFKYMPEKEVGIDSTWNYSYDSTLGVFQSVNTATSSLKNIEEKDGSKIAEIEVDLGVQISGDGNRSENGVNYTFTQPKVSGSGKTFFNLDKGYLIKAETSTSMDMRVNVSGNDPQRGPINASRSDLTENKNYLELLEVN